jgi:hypothetical protein
LLPDDTQALQKQTRQNPRRIVKLTSRPQVLMPVPVQDEVHEVSEMDGPVEPEFSDASLRLNEGLRICRAVLSNYRVLLSGHRVGANDDDEERSTEADG